MICIQNPVESCFKLLGTQKRHPGEKYRKLSFLINHPTEEGVLIFNTLTKEMVLLSFEENALFEADPLSLPELVAHWFAVPEDHNDRELALQYKSVARLITPLGTAITSFTIFTTTDCNARCFYCYELGKSRIPMSLDTAERVASFIISQSNNKRVSLYWFGGEPLFNKVVITRICSILRDANVEYKSSMISNAYLMDADTIEEAKSLWKLKGMQITIDGTEDIYNKTKAYIYKTGSPYKTVIANIHHLLDAGISISIRLNASLRNIDNLLMLIDDLRLEFGIKKNLIIYPAIIYGLGQSLTKEQLSILFEKIQAIQKKLYDWGYYQNETIPNRVKGCGCMADNDVALSILPDGHLGKCEHYSSSDWFGHIDSPAYDQAVISSYKEEAFFPNVCDDCAIYPECHRLKKCNPENPCYVELRNKFILEYKYSMLYTYEKFKKGELTDKPSDDDPQA